jgi:hypothetical protein
LCHFLRQKQIAKKRWFRFVLPLISNEQRTLLCLYCVCDAFISRFNKFALNDIEIDLVQAETEGQDLKEKIGTH